MSFTTQEKAHCVIWYANEKSQAVVQRKFRAHFMKHGNGKKVVPNKCCIKLWYTKFMNNGDVKRKKRKNTVCLLLGCKRHF
jgi:Helix-turn-helix domain (DUF4817)